MSTSLLIGVGILLILTAYMVISRITHVVAIFEKHNFFKEASPQIFISYKSQYSIQVAAVAEALMALGYKLWFDQYRIPLEERLSSKPQFAQYLKEGIDACDKAILFTNRLYSKAEWCIFEIEEILDRYSEGSVFEVQIPNDFAIRSALRGNEARLCKLNNVPTIEWNFGRDNLDYVGRIMDGLQRAGIIHPKDARRPKMTYETKSGKSQLRIEHANICFDTSSWQGNRLSDKRDDARIFGQWIYGREVGNVQLYLHILAQHSTESQRPRVISDEDLDDRQVVQDNLKIAKYHTEIFARQARLRYDLVGIHLVPLLGLSHLAITYFVASDIFFFLYPCYMRKYVLTFPGHDTDKDVDVILTVKVHNKEKIGDLADFLSYMPVFAEFVHSATWCQPDQ
ncbi:MAG: toll/interleukin-1 receptor domain-containing protein [Thermodesulfobacteriota bacterium]|nr:toll/interleukin-1 receptor domain-containing protein [Thermodesulfobacteriota bacterium]